MIYLLDTEKDTFGYLDGNDCKDLDNNILGHIKRDDDDAQLSYILSKDLIMCGQLHGNVVKGTDGSAYCKVVGNDLINDYNEIIGRIKIDDIEDSKDVVRAGAALFWFFDLTTNHYREKHTKKAEKGNAIDQFNLAIEYFTGKFVVKTGADFQSYEKAAYWFGKAAEQGDAQAQLNLGSQFFKGNGVPKDIDKAIEWYEKAVKGGEGQAVSLLTEAKEIKAEAEKAQKEKEDKERREREAREERERKERKQREWLASEDGQKWQEEERRKKEERERLEAEERQRLQKEIEARENRNVIIRCIIGVVLGAGFGPFLFGLPTGGNESPLIAGAIIGGVAGISICFFSGKFRDNVIECTGFGALLGAVCYAIIYIIIGKIIREHWFPMLVGGGMVGAMSGAVLGLFGGIFRSKEKRN
ncbi:MAG: sel1 repeat family protein [Treponema sp.]|jgi:hypothetical protein|nr:sel1 repeat family protein [Treponema sp.]